MNQHSAKLGIQEEKKKGFQLCEILNTVSIKMSRTFPDTELNGSKLSQCLHIFSFSIHYSESPHFVPTINKMLLLMMADAHLLIIPEKNVSNA